MRAQLAHRFLICAQLAHRFLMRAQLAHGFLICAMSMIHARLSSCPVLLVQRRPGSERAMGAWLRASCTPECALSGAMLKIFHNAAMPSARPHSDVTPPGGRRGLRPRGRRGGSRTGRQALPTGAEGRGERQAGRRPEAGGHTDGQRKAEDLLEAATLPGGTLHLGARAPVLQVLQLGGLPLQHGHLCTQVTRLRGLLL